jgi:hypothetical protein
MAPFSSYEGNLDHYAIIRKLLDSVTITIMDTINGPTVYSKAYFFGDWILHQVGPTEGATLCLRIHGLSISIGPI